MSQSIIYIPKMPKLECDSNGKISFKSMHEYFKIIGQIPNHLRVQAGAIAHDCAPELFEAIAKMEKLIDEITGILMTDVFKKIKAKEQEMEYKVREFFKEIDIFLQKKIVEIIIKIIGILGIPNPLEIPIPFLSPIEEVDSSGKVTSYQPKIKDLFTKEGKVKIKASIAKDIEKIKKFFGDDGAYDGTFGIKSPEHEAEELWQKIMHWLRKMLNNFILSAIEAMINLLKKIPIIGQIVSAIEIAYDPTIALDKMFEKAWEKLKADVKKAKEDFLSGKILTDLSHKLIDTFINTILGIKLPFVGSVGELLGISLEEEYSGKFKTISKENILHRIKDGWKDAMEKIRKFIHGGFIKIIYDAILKLPGWILKQFPIVGKIFDVIDKIVKLLTGQNPLTVCEIINIILKPIFNLSDLILAFVPKCIHLQETEFGFPPDSPAKQIPQPAAATT